MRNIDKTLIFAIFSSMNLSLRDSLFAAAKQRISQEDPSHDFLHACRVARMAERITESEQADLDVIVPAALFHDVVNYPKNDPRSARAADESADMVAGILRDLPDYPQEKIEAVQIAIRQCSFSKNIVPEQLEARVLQDADMLEAAGAFAIMRTFCSTGQMKRPFYNAEDPFCEHREPDPKSFAVDLFYARLLKVQDRVHTNLAKEIVKQRTAFLNAFLDQIRSELA